MLTWVNTEVIKVTTVLVNEMHSLLVSTLPMSLWGFWMENLGHWQILHNSNFVIIYRFVVVNECRCRQNSGIISNKRHLSYCNIGLFSSIFWTRVQHKSLNWQAFLRNGIMKEDPISNSSNFALKISFWIKNCIRFWTSLEITRKFSSQDFGLFDTFGIIAQASIFENFSFLGRS